MAVESFIALVVFSFVASITPGPSNLLLLTSGVNYGFSRTIPHVAGIVTGFILVCLAVGFGIGALLLAYPEYLDYLKGVAAGYLVYLAWRIAFSKALEDGKDHAKARPMNFFEAFLFPWLNPKAWFVSIAAMSLYVNPFAIPSSIIFVALVFAAVHLPCIAAWVIFGTGLRAFLSNPHRLRVFNWVMGVLLLLTIIPIAFA